MKKDVGMTTAQKSKETRRMKWDQSLFCTSSQHSLHIRRVASDYNVVYVGIVGWMYRTKIDPISSFLFPYFFEQWSSLHLFSFHTKKQCACVTNVVAMTLDHLILRSEKTKVSSKILI